MNEVMGINAERVQPTGLAFRLDLFYLAGTLIQSS